MKKRIVSVVASCLISVGTYAQSVAPAKINLLNMVYGYTTDIRISIDEKKSVQVRSRTWTVMQTVGDSLGFIIDHKPYSLHFEAGKQYYFVVQSSYNSRPVITEKSEREFLLTAAINSVKGPEEITIPKAEN